MNYLTKIFSMFLLGYATISFAGGVEGPAAVDGATTVDVAEATKLFENEVAFIDVRKDKDWEAGRIPEAYHLDVKKGFSEVSLSKIVNKNDAVVFYCNGIKCLRSAVATEKAISWGYTNVKYFRTGFPSWRSSGNPVE